MARFGFRVDTKEDMYYNEIVVCAHNIVTLMGSLVNMIWGGGCSI